MERPGAKSPLADLAGQLERISAAYAQTFGIVRSRDWFVTKLQEEMGEAVAAWLRGTGQSRHKVDPVRAQADLADELADLLGHVLLFARNEGIDIDEALRRKWLVRLTSGEDEK